MFVPGRRFFYSLILGLIAGATCCGDDRPSPDEPLASRQARFQRADQYLLQLDTNHNGQIDASEVQTPVVQRIYQRYYIERTGLAPNFPMSISQIRAGLADWFRLSADQIPPPPSAAATTTSSSSTATGGTAAPAASGVPGFGVANGLPIPPGFGPPAQLPAATTIGRTSAYTSTSTSYSPSSSSSASSSYGSGSNAAPLDDRYRPWAQYLVHKYDTNKNGVLDHDEWKDIHGSIDFQAADANRDGTVTVDELAAYLASRYSKPSAARTAASYTSPSTAAPGSSSTKWKSSLADSSRGGGASTDATIKSVRFLTPAERLPDGLPDWFRAKDTNGNGQISMAEFATTWTEALVREFNSYDLNGDGVITAQEVLAKLAADAAAAGSRTTLGSDRSSPSAARSAFPNGRSYSSGYSSGSGSRSTYGSDSSSPSTARSAFPSGRSYSGIYSSTSGSRSTFGSDGNAPSDGKHRKPRFAPPPP